MSTPATGEWVRLANVPTALVSRRCSVVPEGAAGGAYIRIEWAAMNNGRNEGMKQL